MAAFHDSLKIKVVRGSPKTNYFDKKLFKKVIGPYKTLLLAPSKLKLVDCTAHNQCLNILENCVFCQFGSKMTFK